MTLGVEYHHRLSVAEAASFCQKMPQGTIDFIEEAIRDETPTAYEALRRMTDVPFAIGEEFSSKWQFLPYVERDIMQFCRIDICNVGGFTEALKAALGWLAAEWRRKAVWAGHFADNRASAQVLVKAGFLYTGDVVKQSCLARGGPVLSRKMVWLA